MVNTKCKPTFSARAKHQIVVQVYSEANDGYGGITRTWSDLIIVDAIIEPKAGKEIVRGGQRDSIVSAIITIRYQDVLSNTRTAAKKRIKYNDRYYNILAVQNLSSLEEKTEGIRYQVLTCEEEEKNVS